MASNDVKLASVEMVHEGAEHAGDAHQGASSGVFVVEREISGHSNARKAMNPLLEQVTLVVYGWKNVQPGTLSWVFPSVGAAVAAARAMRNAVKWAIVAGRREVQVEQEEGYDPLDDARAHGAVLIEEAG